MPAIATIPMWPGLLDRMIQTTLIERAKDISLSLSLQRLACPIHESPLMALRLTCGFENRFFFGAV